MPETFHHELYSSDTSSLDLYLSAVIAQQASIKPEAEVKGSVAGADSALANLKSSLASYAQEKEANK